MKKLFALLILALVGFYIAWPAWSGYRIAAALQAKDTTTLAGKIDFPSVRESLRPAVAKEVDTRLTQQLAAAGGAGQLIGGDVKKQLMPKIVDQVLATLVTPENVIRIAGDAAGVTAAVQKIVMEQASKMAGGIGGMMPGGISGTGGNAIGIPGLPAGLPGIPGLGGANVPPPVIAPAPAAKPASTPAPAPAKPASFGFGNIKGFGFDGPLGFSLSLARDASQPKADVTAGMAFKDMDWKLVRLVPNM